MLNDLTSSYIQRSQFSTSCDKLQCSLLCWLIVRCGINGTLGCRNVYNLLGDLMEILDTPSKKSLWVYIIPLLSVPHQRYCQTRLGLPEHVIKTGRSYWMSQDNVSSLSCGICTCTVKHFLVTLVI